MSTENQFILFVSIIVVAILSGLGIMVVTQDRPRAEPVKEEFISIGNGIQRTDDLEKGISCYRTAGAALSCVKVKP